ncbi:MAG: hypothetical protein LAN36_01540 [Acidobacteriia bacterium]|nr:hypothetical protein [Terriglobia bacterium]
MPDNASLKSAIEVHDSVLAAVDHDSVGVTIHLAPAYIHKSTGEPGVDPGTGWIQNVILAIEEGSIEGEIPKMPCKLSDGRLNVGQRLWENTIPLPVECNGNLKLVLTGMWGGELTITGKRIFSKSIGEPEYVEKFSGASK